MPTKPSHVGALDLWGIVAEELESSIIRPNILSYKPYPEQERFHRSRAFGRYVAGGNRGGKTDSIVVESIWNATNTHPYRKRPAAWGSGPIQQRFVVVDVEKGVNQIILPKLKRWIPRSYLLDGEWDKSWDNKGLQLTFDNGSTIEFLTHGMGLEKHGGVPRHIVYFDEEPPRDVFNETLVRLIDYEGQWVIGATPVQGMGWTFDLLWERAKDGTLSADEVETFTLSASQNPYLQTNDISRQRYYIGMDDAETRTREKGEFVARSGLVFPNFTEPTHVVEPMTPPKSWTWYSSADFGWNNPTAWLWHAVSPEGDIVTFAEHYQSQMTIPEHAAVVHAREAGWGKVPNARTGDPAGNQTMSNTGMSHIQEYAQRGIYIGTEGIPHSVVVGIEKMQQYLKVRNLTRWGTNRPKWVVTSNCTNFIREMKKLRWATYESSRKAYDSNAQEQVHKKDDHAFDSARYFATLMPNLSMPEDEDLVDRVPTTISYSEMMNKLRQDESVSFAEDNRASEWEITQGDYEGAW